MVVQTATRQVLLEKLADAINHLSDEQLQRAWEQIDALATADADQVEQLEFTVSPRPHGSLYYLRLPLRTSVAVKAVMEVDQVSIPHNLT